VELGSIIPGAQGQAGSDFKLTHVTQHITYILGDKMGTHNCPITNYDCANTIPPSYLNSPTRRARAREG
jgi:hypothetical protein